MIRALVPAIALALLAGACDSGPDELVVMTHSSFVMSEASIEAFEEANGIDLVLLPSGDAGAMLNQAILTKDNPVADVIFGIDNTFLSRALEEELFSPYASPLLDVVPDDLELDPEHRVTPIDFGDVCLNFDRAAFLDAGVPVPVTLRALTDPTYRGRLVVEDPATSSPGLAFLLATIATFGQEGPYTWQDYWRDLVENDVLAVAGWEEAYYNEFSGAGDGDRPLVVSYASSPPAEVIFSEEPLVQAPTGVIPAGCFRQIEFAGIVAGTDAESQAQALIDFWLTVDFQEEIPLSMFVFPANSEAELPQEFVDHTTIPDDPVTIDPAAIEANREEWIQTWTEIVR
jgi:thiamine transport system substrate-binding protein